VPGGEEGGVVVLPPVWGHTRAPTQGLTHTNTAGAPVPGAEPGDAVPGAMECPAASADIWGPPHILQTLKPLPQECLCLVEKRETRYRVQWYYRLFEETQRGLTRAPSLDAVHGSLLALGELLRHTGAQPGVPNL
jgi:hypothetical protein